MMGTKVAQEAHSIYHPQGCHLWCFWCQGCQHVEEGQVNQGCCGEGEKCPEANQGCGGEGEKGEANQGCSGEREKG